MNSELMTSLKTHKWVKIYRKVCGEKCAKHTKRLVIKLFVFSIVLGP